LVFFFAFGGGVRQRDSYLLTQILMIDAEQVCQKEAWNRGHKDECRVFKTLGDRELPKAVVACMELLSRRKHGRIADDEWARVCGLQSHIDDFKKNLSYPNIALMAMGASQFSVTHDLFDTDLVAAMYARVSYLRTVPRV